MATTIKYDTADVDRLKLFYREAGPAEAPKLLLLNGFPSASHMFSDLIPLLADRFPVVAPNLPGFGQSDTPARKSNIARVIERFVEVIGFHRFAVYAFDCGAPTGFRLPVRHPKRITVIISQNGNAYEEGQSEGWTAIRAYCKEPSQANRKALRALLAPETTRWQYTHGAPDPTMVSPEGRNLDILYLTRPGRTKSSSISSAYKRRRALFVIIPGISPHAQAALLAVWGKNDPFFVPAGAEAFKRDNPRAGVRFFDTGHFALETHAREIASAIRDFLHN